MQILPPAPADLTACYESMGGPNVCNHLAWTGSSGVTYNVYRNSSSPVPIDAGHRIASGVTETVYTDCGRYKNYYYAVTAVNENGESAPSNEAQASEPCGFAAAMTLPVLNAMALTEGGGDPVVTKYYFHGGKRVAMARDGVVQWLVGDHLGTTSLVMDDQGSKVAESRHYPYGEERWRWPQEGTFPIDYRFTGQRSDGYIKLVHMGVRHYDPALGRWISADTLVPDPANPLSYNRYSWVLGNPLRYTDPSGHGACSGDDYDPACEEDFPGLPEPLFDNPVLQWLYSMSVAQDATYLMFALPVIWLAELGDDVQRFGPDDPRTQEVANDPAMDQFFEAWAEEGHPKEFSWAHEIDLRSEELPLSERVPGGVIAYARENAEMMLAPLYPASVESRVDAVGGILGSYDMIYATEVAPGIARIEVVNRMGFASLTRKPGTNDSVFENTPRRDPGGIGGTVTFVFYWYVPIP